MCRPMQERLKELGVSVLVTQAVDTSVASGAVIRTDPAAGSQVAAGSTVVMYISRPQVATTTKVPSLTGMSTADARTLLVQNHLGLGSQTEQYSDQPVGTVISQNPAAGCYHKAERPREHCGKRRAGACTGTGSTQRQHHRRRLVERPVWQQLLFFQHRDRHRTGHSGQRRPFAETADRLVVLAAELTEACMKGYITKGIGGFYYVKTPEGIVECKPRGIFRKQKITPVAGDEVTLETENGAAVIAEIAPRKNVFVRPPVANLDVLFLVASTTQPTPSTLVLDKLAAIAVDKGVQPVIVCTKGDLAEAEFLRKAYEKSTLPFIRIDYETGGGLDEVKQWISGRLCAFCGNSGVGKSTLLNHLLPEAERETSAISQKLGRGRHTTREVTIFEAFGGRIADTPGFASLEANRAGFIPKENLEHAFPEFGPYLGQCQFTGCSHRSR